MDHDAELIVGLLGRMVETESSDLHLVPGYAPTYRTHGRLRRAGEDVLDGAAVRRLIEAVVPEPYRSRIGDEKSTDCALAVEFEGKSCRFRANIFRARGEIGGCFRYVPDEIPSFEWMGFPTQLAERIVALPHGLVIVTGVTGSGKTTTLAGLVALINRAGGRRVITVEEPVEFVYPQNEGSLITQREVGVDVDSFHDGLVSGLRQDPDVILVGEIRDRDTARMALSAAETGHLILTTLHTQDAKGAVTRLTDLFPRDGQDDVRSQLSLSLRYIICQHLLTASDEASRRALALEVLTATHSVRAAIRFGKVETLESAIQTGRKDGMVALDESLAHLALSNRITWETARHFAKDPNSLSDYVTPRR